MTGWWSRAESHSLVANPIRRDGTQRAVATGTKRFLIDLIDEQTLGPSPRRCRRVQRQWAHHEKDCPAQRVAGKQLRQQKLRAATSSSRRSRCIARSDFKDRSHNEESRHQCRPLADWCRRPRLVNRGRCMRQLQGYRARSAESSASAAFVQSQRIGRLVSCITRKPTDLLLRCATPPMATVSMTQNQ